MKNYQFWPKFEKSSFVSGEVQEKFGRGLVEVRERFGRGSVEVRERFRRGSVEVRERFG